MDTKTPITPELLSEMKSNGSFSALPLNEQILLIRRAFDENGIADDASPERPVEEVRADFILDVYNNMTGMELMDVMKQSGKNNFWGVADSLDTIYDNIVSYSGISKNDFYDNFSRVSGLDYTYKKEPEVEPGLFGALGTRENFSRFLATPVSVDLPALYEKAKENIVKGIDAIPTIPSAIVQAFSGEEPLRNDIEDSYARRILAQSSYSPADIAFLARQSAKGGTVLEANIASMPQENRALIMQRVDDAIDKHGDPSGFFSNLFGSMSSIVGEQNQRTPVTGRAKVGAIAGSVAAPLAYATVGSYFGPLGAVAGLATYFIQRNLVESGYTPEEINQMSEEQRNEAFQRAIGASIGDTAMAAVPMGIAGKVSRGLANAPRAANIIATEAASTVAGGIAEAAITGNISPEGIALSAAIPSISLARQGVNAVGRRASASASNAVGGSWLDPTDYIRITSELDVDTRTASGSLIPADGDITPARKTKKGREAVAEAITIHDNAQRTPMSEKDALFVKSVESIENFDSTNASLLIDNITEQLGMSPAQQAEVRSNLFRISNSRTANTTLDSINKVIESNSAAGGKSAARSFYQVVADGVRDSVENATVKGKEMVDLVLKTDDEKRMIGAVTDNVMDSFNRFRQTHGKKAWDAVIAGLRGADDSFNRMTKNMSDSSLRAVREQIDMIKKVNDGLFLLNRGVGVKQINPEAMSFKIKKIGDEFVVVFSKDTTGGVKGAEVPHDLLKKHNLYSRYDDINEAKRALSEAQRMPLRYEAQYIHESVDWSKLATAPRNDVKYLVTMLAKDKSYSMKLTPKIKAALDSNELWEKLSRKEKLSLAREARNAYTAYSESSKIQGWQISRTDRKIPTSLLDTSIDNILNTMVKQWETYVVAKNYGADNNKLYGYIKEIAKEAAVKYDNSKKVKVDTYYLGKEKPSSNEMGSAMAVAVRAKMFADMATGNHTESKIHGVLQAYNLVQMMAKFGLSSVSQMTQQAAVISYSDLSSWSKSVAEHFTQVAKRDKDAAFKWASGLSLGMDTARQQVEASLMAANRVDKLAAAQGKVLKFYGISLSDMVNRSVAAAAGKYHAMSLVDSYVSALNKNNTRTIAKFGDAIRSLGIEPDRLVLKDNAGVYSANYSTYDLRMMSARFETDTQFKNFVYNMPEWRHGNVGIGLMSMRTFIWQQARLNKAILKRIFNKNNTALESAGMFSRYALAYGISGIMVNQMKDMITGFVTDEDTRLDKLTKGQLGLLNYALNCVSVSGALGLYEIPVSILTSGDTGLGPLFVDAFRVVEAAALAPTSANPGGVFERTLAASLGSPYKQMFRENIREREDFVSLYLYGTDRTSLSNAERKYQSRLVPSGGLDIKPVTFDRGSLIQELIRGNTRSDIEEQNAGYSGAWRGEKDRSGRARDRREREREARNAY